MVKPMKIASAGSGTVVQIAGQRGQADHTEQNDQNRGEATQRHEGCANDADPQQCLRSFMMSS